MSVPTGYLKHDELKFLFEAWRDDFAFRAGLSFDLAKNGKASDTAQNRTRLLECATIYLALKELLKEYDLAGAALKNDDTFGSGAPDGWSDQ